MANLLSNPSFESPALSDWAYTPTDSAWSYASFAGIDRPSGPFVGTLPIPDGGQVAFLQSTPSTGGSISQDFAVGSSGNYVLTFRASQKTTAVQDFDVKIDGVIVAHFMPGATWATYSVPLTLSAGSHTLAFVATNTLGSDDTAAVLDLVSIDAGGAGAGPVPGGTFIAANNAAWIYSPYAFYPDGTKRRTNCNGNGFRVLFNSKSCTLAFPDTWNASALLQSDIIYRVDNLEWVRVNPVGGIDCTRGVPLDPDIDHILEVVVSRLAQVNAWTGSNPGLGFAGLLLDAGATVSAPDRRTYDVLVYADSFGEGVFAVGQEFGNPFNLAECAFAYLMGEALDAEVGVIASAGQGYTATGSRSFPAFPSTWDKYYEGTSRLVGGQFSPAPDLVYLAIGNNDANGGAPVQAAAVAAMTGMLTAGAAKILHQGCPYTGGGADASIIAAIAQVNDPRVLPILATSTIGFSPAFGHPFAAFHRGKYLPRIVKDIRGRGLLSVAGSSTSTDPGVANVRAATAYTIDGVSKTGSLVVASLANTKVGVAGDGGNGTYDGSDRWTALAAGQILSGVSAKVNSTTTNVTGNVTLPTASQLLVGASCGVGGNSIVGNVILPPSGKVEEDYHFGANGSLVGSLVVSVDSGEADLSGLPDVEVFPGVTFARVVEVLLASAAGNMPRATTGSPVLVKSPISGDTLWQSTPTETGGRSVSGLNLGG